jgi:hypothetical protein
MPLPPPCTRLGRHCRELTVTVRIADLDDDSQTLRDAAATWLLAHTERITMGKPYIEGDELLVDATVHVQCKYLTTVGAAPDGRRAPVRCAAHGFRGRMPSSTQQSPEERAALRRGNGAFSVVYRGRQRVLDLPVKRAARRALPVVQNHNPCIDAPCRTGDNKQGAACCRDLTLEIALPESATRMEALLKARKSPYLCKVTREGDDTVEAEVISACGYLERDGITCGLHDRTLPNGRLAKPSICMEWPDLGPDDEGHPGCRLT